MATGYQHHLERHPWQFFCTLTFRTEAQRGITVAACMYAHWLREVAKTWNLHTRKLLQWPAPEFGEIGGNYHIHSLLSGAPDSLVTPSSEFVLEALWRRIGGGHPKCRVVDARLSFAAYMEKQASLDGANRYEFNKFSQRDLEARFKLIPAPLLLRMWQGKVETNRRLKRARDMRRLPRRDHSSTRGPASLGTARFAAHPADGVRLYV